MGMELNKWRPIKEAPIDYTEIIGLDNRGRVFKTWYFAPSSQTKGWIRCDTNTKWYPEWFIDFPKEKQY